MAQAPRQDNKGTKVAYKVLGKPENMVQERTKKQIRLDLILMNQDIVRVR